MSQEPFIFRKVLYLVEATGRRAATLDELLRVLNVIDPDSVGYHMHHAFLAHKFVHTEYPNDFAHWAARVVGDEMLAERLANVVVFRFRSLEAVRAELGRLIADHLIAHPEAALARAPRGREFYFARSRQVVMNCGRSLPELSAFANALAQVPSSSIYFHLFETRFSGAAHRENDFAEWLRASLGLTELAHRVAEIDPYMYSLDQARRKILDLLQAELPAVPR